jgi:hypothetical protein
MKKDMLYVGMILASLTCLILAIVFEVKSSDDSTPQYEAMAPAVRIAESEALRIETEKPLVSSEQYFKILSRLELLERACMRADREEKGDVALGAREMYMNVSFLERNWVEKLRVSRIPESKDFGIARDNAGNDPNGLMRHTTNRPFHQDPRATLLWCLFYFGSVIFTVVHFSIQLRDMGCKVWPEIVSNWKFSLWSVVWVVGLFKYPREIDPTEQMKLAWLRVYRFATLVLSSSITFFAAVQTAAAQKDDGSNSKQNHTLHVDISTLTFPRYLGGNGAIFHEAPVQQTNVFISLPRGFYADVWNSIPFADFRNPNFGFEIDGTVGWSGKAKGIKLTTELGYVNATPLGQFRGDVFKTSGMVSRNFAVAKSGALEPYFLAERFAPVKGIAPQQGVFLHGGVRHSWTVTRRFRVDSVADFFHDGGAFGFEHAYLIKANTGGSWKLSDHWALQLPAIQYSVPLTHVTDGRRPQLNFGGGLAFHY